MHLARLQYLGEEGTLCEVHVAGGDPVQPAPDHGGGEDQHLLPLNASKQVAALIIHYTYNISNVWLTTLEAGCEIMQPHVLLSLPFLKLFSFSIF